MTRRDVVFPPGRQALYERNRYSPAIRSNGFLFVSGQVGSTEDGSPEPDLEKQVRLASDSVVAVTFDNFSLLLERSYEHQLFVSCSGVNLEDYQRLQVMVHS